MTDEQTQRKHLREAAAADKAYQLWIRIEVLSTWLMEHYWHEIADRLEARQCMDEWPPEICSQTPTTAA
jgi:hypothetical protein